MKIVSGKFNAVSAGRRIFFAPAHTLGGGGGINFQKNGEIGPDLAAGEIVRGSDQRQRKPAPS
jgi:hypothetical protein